MPIRMKPGVALGELNPERLANEMVSFFLKQGNMTSSRMVAFMVDGFRLMREQCAAEAEAVGATQIAGRIRSLPGQTDEKKPRLILPTGFRVNGIN